MELIEADPLPEACRQCGEQYCDECEYAGERWTLPQEEWKRLALKAGEKAIVRLQREMEQLNNKNDPQAPKSFCP